MSHSTEIKIKAPCVELLIIDLTREPAEVLGIWAGREHTYTNELAVAAYELIEYRMSRYARHCVESVIYWAEKNDPEIWGDWLTITVKHCE